MTISSIKEALAAGPTPGPWHPGHFGSDHPKSIVDEVHAGGIATVQVDNGLPMSEGGNDAPSVSEAAANMRFIAACDPDTIAALISSYEEMEKRQVTVPIDGDKLAQEIRRVDGNHSLGAGALAEALIPFLSAALHPHQEGEKESSETPPPQTHVWGEMQAEDCVLSIGSSRVCAHGTLGCVNHHAPAAQNHLTSIEEYVEGYSWRGDEGDYTPTDHEKAMLIDALHGATGEVFPRSAVRRNVDTAEMKRLIDEGRVFADANPEAQFIEAAEMACPHCGGSGHKDDIRPPQNRVVVDRYEDIALLPEVLRSRGRGNTEFDINRAADAIERLLDDLTGSQTANHCMREDYAALKDLVRRNWKGRCWRGVTHSDAEEVRAALGDKSEGSER